ncbi:cardiolipin synthase [Aestuariivirga litoralis]|uniref:Cardiolipin synthase n=1 Tax=Aestuariivirga litoralis TaxID=2650924 RepID=A0A2W2BH86_9HYPH|nr:cardiolipin synthase [Aestuariivirga litoralis]PZF75519.1 cardiolipin synthase [Aestuariivirga litoralis]
MTSLIIIVIHAALMAAVILRVLLRRPARGVALAWLLMAMMLPYIGAVLYFLIGERRISRSRAERLAQMQGDFRKITAPHIAENRLLRGSTQLTPEERPLERAGESFFGAPAFTGNSLALSGDTLAMLRHIAADIEAAERSVLVEFYIWTEGGLTRDVLDALTRAARRGVKCLVLVDAMGAGRWWRGPEPGLLRGAGVELRAALPVGLLRGIAGRTDLRLHRKIVVVDSRIAWTGSMNMVDPRFFKQDSGVGEWVDAMVRIEGPVAGVLGAVMISDWVAEGGVTLEQVLAATGLAPSSARGQAPVQVLASGPGESGDGLLQIMLALINGARHEVVLTTPYFVPEDALVTALRGAAARGVRVVVVLPRRIDSLLVRHASRSFFDEIISAGCEIYEFKAGLLHTKSITVDGEQAMFGTANFDMRSLWLNYEVSLLVYDRGFVADLRALQQSYLDQSDAVMLVPWAKRPVGARLIESTMRLMTPLL